MFCCCTLPTASVYTKCILVYLLTLMTLCCQTRDPGQRFYFQGKMMSTDLVQLICVHYRRPVFSTVFCYSAVHLLRDRDPSFCAQRVLSWKPDRTVPRGNAGAYSTCLRVLACMCPSVRLLIDHPSACCLLWAFMLEGINNLLLLLHCVSPWIKCSCAVDMQMHTRAVQ